MLFWFRESWNSITGIAKKVKTALFNQTKKTKVSNCTSYFLRPRKQQLFKAEPPYPKCALLWLIFLKLWVFDFWSTKLSKQLIKEILIWYDVIIIFQIFPNLSPKFEDLNSKYFLIDNRKPIGFKLLDWIRYFEIISGNLVYFQRYQESKTPLK